MARVSETLKKFNQPQKGLPVKPVPLSKIPEIPVPKAGISEVIKGIPAATKKLFTEALPFAVQELGTTALTTGKEVAQSIPRAAATAALTGAQALGKDVTYTPKTKPEKVIFGTETIKPLATSIAEQEMQFQQAGLGKGSLPAAFGVGVLGTALDLTPFGAPGKTVGKKLAGEVIAKYGKEVGEQIIKEGGEKAVKSALQTDAETFLKTYARKEVAPAVKAGARVAETAATKAGARVAETIAPRVAKTIAPRAGARVAETIAGQIPPTQPVSVFKELEEALKQAQKLTAEQAKIYSEERAKRIGAAMAVGKKSTGEAGFFKELGQLKGPLTKVDFEALRPNFTQAKINQMFEEIKNSPVLGGGFDSITARQGLLKILDGQLPTRSEIKLLSEVMPKSVIDALMDKRANLVKLFDLGTRVANVPRELLSSFDLSAPLRQGFFLISRPRQFLPAFWDMFKYFFSQKQYEKLGLDIIKNPYYKKMRNAGLALTDVGDVLTNREEAFMAGLVEKIPGIGRIAKGSSRAYTGFLNKLRADTFADLAKKAELAGVANRKTYKDLARFINSATGRGTIQSLERAMPILNSVLFSPRLVMSRINMLNPYTYATYDPFVRKEALKTLLGTASIAGSVLGLASLAGADVETDPRSADFAKIKVGNTRYDVLGGFQQYFRTLTQFITGQKVSSTTGQIMTVGEGYKPLTRTDILAQFGESKLNPIASLILNVARGTTYTGEKTDIPTEVIARVTPLILQDLYSLYQDPNTRNLLQILPSVFGVGTQTYGASVPVTGIGPLGKPVTEIKPQQGLPEKIRSTLLGAPELTTTPGFAITSFTQDLYKMPKEQRNREFARIAQENPELAKKIVKEAQDMIKGITPQDKAVRALGIANGDRAKRIAKELKDLKTRQERERLWQDYVNKKIITAEVAAQINELLK